MNRIGIDVGFGYSKAVWLQGDQFKSLVIPSVFGRAATIRNMDLGLGSPATRRAFRVMYRDEEYLIGADALLHSQTGLTATQTFARIGSDEERILLLALLAKVGLTDVAIVTGLPVLAWDQRHALRRSWTGTHHIRLGRRDMEIHVREVRTAWQPVLSLYDYALTIREGQPVLDNGMDEEKLRRGWLVVDPGHNTTDRAGVINLIPIDQYSGGARVGGRDILAVIGKTLSEKYGIYRSPAEIENALRHGYIDVYSDRVDLLPLAHSAAASLAAQIATDVSSAIGDGSQFYGILLTGGPAKVIQPSIIAACPRNMVILLPDSQIANARGGCKFAQGLGVFKLDRR